MALNWLANAPALLGRYRVASAVVNNKLYAAGGLISTGTTNRNDQYDPVADAWTQKTVYPKSVRNMTGVGMGNYAYFFGGYDGVNFLTDVNRFDPAAASSPYLARAAYPTTVNAAAIGTNGTYVYIFGGYNAGVYTTACRRYDPALNTYTNLKAKPNSCAYVGVVYYNGLFYILGGYDGSVGKTYLDVYNPANDTWVTKAPAPYPVWQNALVNVGDKIYSIGEYPAVNRVMVYDPAADTWTVDTANNYPVALQSPMYGVMNAAGYVIGGYNGTAYLTQNYGFQAPAAAQPRANDLGVGYTNAYSIAKRLPLVEAKRMLGYTNAYSLTKWLPLKVSKSLSGSVHIWGGESPIPGRPVGMSDFESGAGVGKISVSVDISGGVTATSGVSAAAIRTEIVLPGSASGSSGIRAAPIAISGVLGGSLSGVSDARAAPVNLSQIISGSVSAVSGVSRAALTTDIPLSGTISGVSGAGSAPIGVDYGLSGSVAAASGIAPAPVSLSLVVSGSVAAVSDIHALSLELIGKDISLSGVLSIGSAVSRTAMSKELTISGMVGAGTTLSAPDLDLEKSLSARQINAISTVYSSPVSKTFSMLGTIDAAGNVSGKLSRKMRLALHRASASGSVHSSTVSKQILLGSLMIEVGSGCSGALTRDTGISGTVSAELSNSADIIVSTHADLSGRISAFSNVTAKIKTAHGLGGRLDIASDTRAAVLRIGRDMGGRASAQTGLSAILGAALVFKGQITAESDLSANLSAGRDMGGRSDALSDSSAVLGIAHTMGSTVRSLGGLRSYLGDRRGLTGRISAKTSTAAKLGISGVLGGSIHAGSGTYAEISKVSKDQLSGRIHAVSSVRAGLSTARVMGGRSLIRSGLSAHLEKAGVDALAGGLAIRSGVAPAGLTIKSIERLSGTLAARSGVAPAGLIVMGVDRLSGRLSIISGVRATMTVMGVDRLSGALGAFSGAWADLSTALTLGGRAGARSGLSGALGRLTQLYPVEISIVSDARTASIHVGITGQVAIETILEIQREIAMTLQIPTSMNFTYDLGGLDLILDLGGMKK